MNNKLIELSIKLDWSEMDLFGHVNNVAYFKYIQAARVNYCDLVGINTSNPENKLSFAVAASSCQFKKPLYYPGNIVVKTRVDWIKNSSFQITHLIYNDKNELAAEGVDVIVLFDYNANKKMNIPDNIRQKM
jgi:acyl-CoA thioester hydrolase